MKQDIVIPILCYAHPRLFSLDDKSWCVGGAPSVCSQWNVQLVQCTPFHTHRGWYKRLIFLICDHPWQAEGNWGQPQEGVWSFDVMFRKHPADVVDGWSNKGQGSPWRGILYRYIFFMMWNEGRTDLPVIVAIQFERTEEEFKFWWETFQVADEWWCDSSFRHRLVWVGFLYTMSHNELVFCTRVYQKVSGLAVWSENCKVHSSLPRDAVVSLFCEWV